MCLNCEQLEKEVSYHKMRADLHQIGEDVCRKECQDEINNIKDRLGVKNGSYFDERQVWIATSIAKKMWGYPVYFSYRKKAVDTIKRWYREIDPSELDFSKKTVEDWEVTHNGVVLATLSVGRLF